MALALATAVLGGLVGALIGLLIALLGQSREDARLRLAEEWRQQAAKQERLRAELETVLQLIYAIDAITTVPHWVTPSLGASDPAYVKLMAGVEALSKEAKAADVRLRLEGATEAWQALDAVAVQHQLFRSALVQFDDDGPRSPILATLAKTHNAIAVVADKIHESFAAYLDALTPPGPLPVPSGLRSWLREAEAWLRR
jgi:hypothetical protein